MKDLPDGALIAPVEKPLRRLRLLVVDDDTNARTTIAAGLRGDGHDVHTFAGGLRALKLHSQQPFDAVIADLVMPGMGGGELAAAVKKQNPSTPVILVTGFPEELTGLPFDLIIRKPFPHCVLRAVLDLLCG